MTCSGIAVTYTCINRFTRHDFIVAMGPAGFLASFYAFFSSSPQTHLPSSLEWYTQVCLPGKGWWPCQGRGKRSVRKGQWQIHGVGGVSMCPKCSSLLRPWTCGLRKGRGKASPVGRTLLGGHAQSAIPPDTLKKRIGGDIQSGTSTPTPVQLCGCPNLRTLVH